MSMYILLFFAGAILDILYVGYIQGVRDDHAARACVFSMAIGGCGLFAVGSVITDVTLAIPYLAGLGVGTYAALRVK